VKTHKSREVARLQLAAGAAGLTAATITEAEAMADAGAAGLLVAYPPVGQWRLERLLALARRVRVSTVVDNATTALALDQACLGADCDLDLLWEVDCGTGRLGTEPGSATAAEVAAVVPQLTRVRFCGVMAFAGHAYSATAEHEVRRAAEEEIRAVRDTAAALSALGIPCPVLSIGSSPTAHYLDEAARGMRCRPGTYVFNDRTQVALGVADESWCALTVLSTVLSRPAPDRVIFDAGSKALSSDQLRGAPGGYGAVLGEPSISIGRLYEEHAIARLPADLDLPIGSRVRIVPNHACTTVNMHRTMLVLGQGSVAGEWATGTAGWS
jgi:D-serine deaminase-like pyridoxal phosphate-dependent protein